MHPLLARQLRREGIDPATAPGEETWNRLLAKLDAAYCAADQDRRMVERSLELSTTEMQSLYRQLAEERDKLLASRTLLQAILNSAGDGILTFEQDGQRIETANSAAQRLFGRSEDELRGSSIQALFPHPESDGSALDPGRLDERHELLARSADGSTFPADVRINAVVLPDRRILMCIVRDITEQREAQQRNQELHAQLLVASRAAGKAEVATGVLHNVGNVLNSVNVSVALMVGKFRKGRAHDLARVSGMLSDHAGDLPAFLVSDPRGRLVPRFLNELAAQLVTDQEEGLRELQALRRNIDHINEIVTMQQVHAGKAALEEPVCLSELLDDAIQIARSGLERHRIRVVREGDSREPVFLDRHQVLQVLTNLLSNAKYALVEASPEDRVIRITVEHTGADQVRLCVADNGIGIPAENLTRIFAHGFTRRRGGHGFGLHSAAIAAKLMGGSLVAHSDGPGRGATFVLTVPVRVPEAVS